MATVAMSWYKDSCGLRFIYAVSSDESFGVAGFKGIIEQGYEDEDDDDE
jgi:hypothetical protein